MVYTTNNMHTRPSTINSLTLVHVQANNKRNNTKLVKIKGPHAYTIISFNNCIVVNDIYPQKNMHQTHRHRTKHIN